MYSIKYLDVFVYCYIFLYIKYSDVFLPASITIEFFKNKKKS